MSFVLVNTKIGKTLFFIILGLGVSTLFLEIFKNNKIFYKTKKISEFHTYDNNKCYKYDKYISN